MLTRYGDHFHFLPHAVRVRHDLSNIHRLHDAAVLVLRNVLCFGDRRKRVRQHMTSDCAATPTRHVNDRYWARRVNELMIVMAASTFWSHLCPVTFSRSFLNKPEPGVCASGLIPLEELTGPSQIIHLSRGATLFGLACIPEMMEPRYPVSSSGRSRLTLVPQL